jgi:radical SAM superfamily enzyme YgiQ (UPF0313 family)
MRVALVGAELEENLGLRYMASALEVQGHEAVIVPFNDESETRRVADAVVAGEPDIAGLSMVFTGRAREFCRLARALREHGFKGHLTAGGHFAALNCQRLLGEFPEFDSVALGEGEELICALAAALPDVANVAGFCVRAPDGTIRTNPSPGNPSDLDGLPFPRRSEFHAYFDERIASVLSSRGCWRSCAFCSIDAWYRSGGGKKFRVRSVENVVAEMKALHRDHGVRIFNFQDDNFFLPDRERALARFVALRDALESEGVTGIAIAVKARPDSITREALAVLDGLGLFRVFLGVENASEDELRNLNRRSSLDEIERALELLNAFDVHVAFNLLLFEPETTMRDLEVNLRFMERHLENPFNFCRAEAYAATGLEAKLRRDGILAGDWFGFDYRLKQARPELFHRIANYAFFDRNFSDSGLHYFNMEVDFSFQLLRRFHPEVLTPGLRGEARSFVQATNLETYRLLSRVYDLVQTLDPVDDARVHAAMLDMRRAVDASSLALRSRGERVLSELHGAYAGRSAQVARPPSQAGAAVREIAPVLHELLSALRMGEGGVGAPLAGFGVLARPIPYELFRSRIGS